MIEIVNDVPLNVAAFRATGKVDSDDYKAVINPAIDALVKSRIRLISCSY